MYRLAEMRYPQVAELMKQAGLIVLLPVGSTEEHGPHLPLEVDSVGAEEFALQAASVLDARGYTTAVAPTMHYAVTKVALPFSGTLSIEPETMERVVVEIGRSLVGHGCRRIAVVNHHGERAHILALDSACRRLEQETGAQAALVGIAPSYHADGATIDRPGSELMHSERPDLEWHAGEDETALMLYRRPETVDRATMVGLRPVFVDLHEHWRQGAKTFKDVPGGELGYFGDPHLADGEVGREIYRLRGIAIADELERRFA